MTLALLLAPVLFQTRTPEDIIKQARDKWLGKTVWVYSASCFSANGTETWNPMLSAKVIGIDWNVPHDRFLFAPAWGDDWCYNAIPGDWYRVTLQLPKMPFHRHRSTVSDGGPQYWPPFFGKSIVTWYTTDKSGQRHSSHDAPRPAATTGWLMFGTLGEIDHQLTTVDPARSLQRSSSRVRKEFIRHHVVKGMSHDEVARILGFPSIHDRIAAQLAADSWSFPYLAPFSVDCTFKNDVLVKIEMTGSLP